MATIRDLETAIDNLLNHRLGIGQYELVRRVEEKAYEAYVFGLCLKAVRELGEIPILRGINGPPNPFIFRGGPGQIHSRTRNYGYAEFSLNNHNFEIHAGVEFKGTSNMTHELDVCIMRAENAYECRQHPDDPPAASLFGCWECKFYAGTLPKHLGRAFVGLIDDMGSNIRLSGLCSNSDHIQLREYLQPKSRPYPNFRLTPLRITNEDIFVNQIKGALKKMTAA
ncbi:hypothetical protein [Methanoregula sp. UBA64]|uniref:hypothetical protein n=1 Tax=Methanoregula sp. UBA64 TaxID=1915554 RepID=UPI0025E97B4E|nr:hypothetical protein [Methanoregula sp. UBA64]